MEGDDVDNCSAEIDDYYVIDAWSAEQGSGLSDHNNKLRENSSVNLNEENFRPRKKSTEDIRGANVPSKSVPNDRSPYEPKRLRSRSPCKHSEQEKRYSSQERARNYSKMDISRPDRNNRDRRRFEDERRPRRSRSRSRSRSRERYHHKRRLYRKSLSLSPSRRKNTAKDKLEQNYGPRDRYGPLKSPILPNQGFVNSNMHPNMVISGQSSHSPGPPVQYSINTVPSGNSYGRFTAYNPPSNDMFNSAPPTLGFQPPYMGQPYPQGHPTQYTQPPPYQGYNSGALPVVQGNTPNSVGFPPPWSEATQGLNQNYSSPNLPTNAVMYPHLKIGQPRIETHIKNMNESPERLPESKRIKSGSEKHKFSRSISPESKRHKRKPSKMHEKSPSFNKKYETSDARYDRDGHRSQMTHSRIDSKKHKMIIDPNRIPTPPPPPIMGSYEKEDLKSNPQKMKTSERKTDNETSLSNFLNKEKVSLSCLLEAVMENSGQGKSQLSEPKVKKEIISKCETKIRHLYKKRIAGLGAFFLEPVLKSSRVKEHVSPLNAVCPVLTYNYEKQNDEWHCPGIIIPEVKTIEKVQDKFHTDYVPDVQYRPESSSRGGNENVNVVPKLTNNQPLPNHQPIHNQLAPNDNWNANMPLPTNFMNNENNPHNIYPPYQTSQNWANPPLQQDPYAMQPPLLNQFGPPAPAYPSYPPVGPEFMPPQQGYPPRPEMLNYPMRQDYPPMQPFPYQNSNHPGMFNARPVHNNVYPRNLKEDPTPAKKNQAINNNLILLSNNRNPQSGEVKTNIQKDKTLLSSSIDLTGNDNLDDKIENVDAEDKNKIPGEKNEAKDKLLRKLWQKRKSSDYIHLPTELKDNKEHQEDGFYNKLKYAEMLEDTQIDSIHEYQLTNLRERVESCLAEGRFSPEHEHSQHRNRYDGDRERDRLRDRERGRDRTRERDRLSRDSTEGDRKRHSRSPLRDDRKKYRSGEAARSRTRSREEHSYKSNREDINELSDEDHGRMKGSDNSTNEKEIVEPSKKLLSIILDVLGPDIRKTQEKSNLYLSIITSLEKGEKTYKRLYFLKNAALIKSEKDKQMRMVVPRDNLKDVVTIIHKNFHDVQIEELNRLLRVILYPNMLHLPKCISKVVSECPTCIEQKKKEDPLKDKKTAKIEKKVEKRIEKTVRDKEKDRSVDREKRITKGSSKSRWDPSNSGRERDDKENTVNDGRPTGYERATKIKKSVAASTNNSDNPTSSDKILLDDKSIRQPEENSSGGLHELSDKALEFKLTSETQSGDQQIISDTKSVSNDDTSLDFGIVNEIDLENKNHLAEVKIPSSVEDKNELSNDTAIVSETPSDSSVTINEKAEPSKHLRDTSEEHSKSVTSTDQVEKDASEEDNKITVIGNVQREAENTTAEVTVDKKGEDVKNFENVLRETDNNSTNLTVDKERDNVKNSEKEEVGPITTENTHEDVRTTTAINVGSQREKTMITENCHKQSNENSENIVNKNQAETTADMKLKVDSKKERSKLDFKGKVRQVQLSSIECKEIILALEAKGETKSVDPSYLIKAGMLCKKISTSTGGMEAKIVTPSDKLEDVVSIVHTMSPIHTPAPKVTVFFTKHFTQVDNLESEVNKFVDKCSYCKIRIS